VQVHQRLAVLRPALTIGFLNVTTNASALFREEICSLINSQ
jgi:hypothetical protein